MKLLKSYSIGLILTLSICSDFGFMGKALADNKSCKGASCKDKDPVEYRCNADARVVARISKTVSRWQDAWKPRKIVIQKIYSERCQANWARAYIPDDSYLYIRERDLVNGTQPIHGLFKANGTGYFWAYGRMSNGSVVNQACVALPGVPLPWGGNSYERYCTEFN
jgi:hypothetical protein